MVTRIKTQLGKTALLLGAGYSAKSMIAPLLARGYDVIATTRSSEKAVHLKTLGATRYLSATSVYGDRQGQWAFEDELLRPLTRRGKNRANAELQWLETGAAVHIFRLAGIYGPGRNGFERLRERKARAVIKAGHVVNRIHLDDIVSALFASIEAPNPLKIYNISDGHPAPPQEVINFTADLIDSPRPPQLNHDTADISDMARS